MKTLDAIDRKLLHLLSENSRMPLTAAAKEVGLSRSATQERVGRLEASGIIAGYTIKRGATANVVQAWLLIKVETGSQCTTVAPDILKIPEARYCCSLAGKIDLLVLAETDSSAGLARLRERIMALDQVAEVLTAPVLETQLDARSVDAEV